MKFFFNILFLITISSLYGQSISQGIAFYRVHKDFSGDLSKLLGETENIEVRKRHHTIMKNAKDLDYKLIFNGKESLYEVIEQLEADNAIGINLTQVLAGGMGPTYTNIVKKDILEKNDHFGDFLINHENLQWEISDETKKIGGFTCNKATATLEEKGGNGIFTKKVEAWFTPEIPAPFGPYYYNGLPGLVIEVTDNRGVNYSLTDLTLNPEDMSPIKRPAGKIITVDELSEMAKKATEALSRG